MCAFVLAAILGVVSGPPDTGPRCEDVLPQFPAAAVCEKNYQAVERFTNHLWDLARAYDMELDNRMLKDLDEIQQAWTDCYLLQHNQFSCECRMAAQERLIEYCGETAFLRGWMPPVPNGWEPK